MKKLLVCLLAVLLFGCVSTGKKDTTSDLERLAEGAAGKWSDYSDYGAGEILAADTFLVRDVDDTTLAATGTQKEYPWSVMLLDLASANYSNVLNDEQALEIMADADGMDDEEYNGVLVTGKNCGENLTAWALVSAHNDADIWHYGDANVAGDFPAIGLSIASCTDTNEAKILTQGVVRNEAWTGLTIGGPVYLSTTPGGITQSAPAVAADCVQIVGWAMSDSEILFDFHRPYSEVE